MSNKTLQIGNYKFVVSPREITISRNGENLVISPADIATIQEGIASISSFRALDTKPPYINSKPFKYLLWNNSFGIVRQNEETTPLEIEWSDIDDFIVALEQIVNVVKDERRLNPGVRSGGWSPPNKGIVIG
jgi:hypothetical protein